MNAGGSRHEAIIYLASDRGYKETRDCLVEVRKKRVRGVPFIQIGEKAIEGAVSVEWYTEVIRAGL